MQLGNLIKPIEEMTDEELKTRLFDIRHRREYEKPAAKAHVQKAAKKESKKKLSAAEKLLEGLTPEELALLLSNLNQ